MLFLLVFDALRLNLLDQRCSHYSACLRKLWETFVGRFYDTAARKFGRLHAYSR